MARIETTNTASRRHSGCYIVPDYQREYVWTDKKCINCSKMSVKADRCRDDA